MAKYYGKIGFIKTEETIENGSGTGVWTEHIIERFYTGDVIRNSRNWAFKSETINSDINISNEISIISDDFARQNLGAMRYVEFMGSLWTISNISVDYPRLTLSIGGLYNGETPRTSCHPV